MDVESKDMKYKEVEIKGKHGDIVLGIPIKKDTQKEIDDLHKAIAEVIINNSRNR
ncbi:hypothetical protein [Terribacillus sp. JSM ZJ617]|uniref:hypothetical protein n=1 Tax=Terribacillus sp. JSM ZJ617 TaxID=3342119 RepID=UPI0035A86430